MGRNRKMDRGFKSTLDGIKESAQTIAKNTGRTNEKLDDMKSDIGKITKSSTSKLPVIIAVITLLVTVSGVSVIGVYDRWKSKTRSEMETANDESKTESEYRIYLYPEYSTFNKGMKIDMTASLKYLISNVNRVIEYYSGRNTGTPVIYGGGYAEGFQ